MKTSALACGLGLFALASGTERAARADNTEPFFYSDDAAMTAGAVGATTRDAGAIWYQPAGLGGIKRGEIDLSGSAFGIRIRNVPNALTTTFPGGARSVDLQSSDIFSAPHALGFVRHINDKVSFGVGLFVTYRDVRTAENELVQTGPALGDATVNGTYRQRIDISVDSTRYHFGPAIGWEIVPGVRVGASLFGTYGKSNGYLQFLIGQTATLSDGSNSTLIAVGQSRIALSYLGMQAQAGVQWDVSDRAALSLLVRSPEILLTSSEGGTNFSNDAVLIPGRDPTAAFTLQKPQSDIAAGTAINPARIIAGVAYRLGENSWLSGEIDIQPPVSNNTIDYQTTVNGRVGARFRLNERWSVGGGLYTDLAQQKAVGDTFGDEKINEVGLSTGVELRTPLSLKDKPDPDALVLSTTIALKYGLGFGQFRAQDTDLVNSADPPPRVVDVIYHTIVPYFGSSILF